MGLFSLLPLLRLGELLERLEIMMGQFETVSALLDDIKTATDANAAAIAEVGVKIDANGMRLQEVIDALRGATGGMTAEQLAALADKAAAIKGELAETSTALEDEVAKLEATGADPDNPTP